MNYNFTNQIVGFYVRGKREKRIDEQLTELFLFAMLHQIPVENTRLFLDRVNSNQGRPCLYNLISNPCVDFLVIQNYYVIDIKYDVYLYLRNALETSNITVIDLHEYAKQAGG